MATVLVCIQATYELACYPLQNPEIRVILFSGDFIVAL